MTIEEMKLRKQELGLTNEMLSDISGVPLGTVQKIFSGVTRSPRYDTVNKLVAVLQKNREKGVTIESTPSVWSPVPVANRIGVAAGKFEVPDDGLFYDDEITEMFEGI